MDSCAYQLDRSINWSFILFDQLVFVRDHFEYRWSRNLSCDKEKSGLKSRFNFYILFKSGPKCGPDHDTIFEFGPVRILFFSKSGPDRKKAFKVWSGPDFYLFRKSGPKYGPVRIIRTTVRTKKIQTEKSGPRTVPNKSVPKNIRTTDRTGPRVSARRFFWP